MPAASGQHEFAGRIRIIGIVLATGASLGLSRLMQVPYLFNPGVNLVSFFFQPALACCSATSRPAGPPAWTR